MEPLSSLILQLGRPKHREIKSSAQGHPARTWQSWDLNPLQLQSPERPCQIQGGDVPSTQLRAWHTAGPPRRVSFPFLEVPRLEPGRKWNEDREAVGTDLVVTGPTVSLGTRSLWPLRAGQSPSALPHSSSSGPRCPPVRKGFPGMSKRRCFCHKVILACLKKMCTFPLKR